MFSNTKGVQDKKTTVSKHNGRIITKILLISLKIGVFVDFCQFYNGFSEHSQKPGQIYLGRLPVIVRMAQMSDIKGLTEVLLGSFHTPQQWFSWLQPLFRLEIHEDLRIRFRSHSPYYCCLVAMVSSGTSNDSQESVIGTVEITLGSRLHFQSLYISNLAVSHSYRRRGVAKHLLQKCEQVALEWGHCSLSLHVLEDNYPAKQLYLNNGYQVQGTEFTWQSWLFKTPRRLFLKKILKSP
ncbi:MAG: GNAT family N-acetyltransferase [cyanobacterium endosymbiont of Rhopalodia musculus]|uniref:GNAT family N-acetyltransferase n=1 Tax=cyanobacterium endosymbiont of Epithemia clementina EcSB TaxID=3034674 RepID=UPI002480645C|nr:GNAT family N-acetyltransferase [cyanobacterium endosymbiont of Epithemia clementina EcSB]WGT68273.1 GNAT family N-acetyltransferase [cyanobacterium endosymbiont of Epithemia clementina EcSB]